LDKNDASTSVEQEYQGDIGASDYNIDSDEQINVGNQTKDVQAESIFADSSEMKDTSTLSEQEFNVLMIVRKSIQSIRQLMQMVILEKILIIQLMQRI
jgi:hypothetical protein